MENEIKLDWVSCAGFTSRQETIKALIEEKISEGTFLSYGLRIVEIKESHFRHSLFDRRLIDFLGHYPAWIYIRTIFTYWQMDKSMTLVPDHMLRSKEECHVWAATAMDFRHSLLLEPAYSPIFLGKVYRVKDFAEGQGVVERLNHHPTSSSSSALSFTADSASAAKSISRFAQSVNSVSFSPNSIKLDFHSARNRSGK